MPDDIQLDEHLHTVARSSLERRAATVDVDAELSSLEVSLAAPRSATPPSHGREQRRWLGAAAAAVLAVGAIGAIAWWQRRAGDQIESVSPPTTELPAGPPATSPPPIVPLGDVGLWLSSERVPVGPSEIVAVLVNDSDRAVTFGLFTTLDRWDGSDWVPLGQLDMCLINWPCVGGLSASDEPSSVPDIGLAPTALEPGPPQRFSTDGLDAGWYRLTQQDTSGGDVSAVFEIAGSAPRPAPLRPIDRQGLEIAPALLTSDGGPVGVWPHLISQGGPIQDARDSPEVAALDEVVRLERWDGQDWVAVTDLDLTIRRGGPLEDSDGVGRTATIPPLSPGEYRLVRAGADEPWVGNLWIRPAPDATISTPPSTGQPSSDPQLANASADPELDVPYFGRRYIVDPPYFEIDEFAPDGATTRTFTAEEALGLIPRFELADGSTLTLAPEAQGRCDDSPLIRQSDESSGPLSDLLPAARSIGVTPDGVVIAARDVCPDGTRWGDPGTRWELVAFDPETSEAPEVLLTRQPDANQIQFDDGEMVIANGAMLIDGVSPDGRYIVLRDLYNIEQSKWHLLDRESPGEPLPVDSTCELAGAIVGPPRFVGNDLVVVARLCATLHVANPTPYDAHGDGDVQVEAVDLNATAPSQRIVWHSSVPGVGAHGYSGTVGLSAQLAPDGSVRAILSGNGDVEEPGITLLLHGDSWVEITRPDHSLAFSPADLVSTWDAR